MKIGNYSIPTMRLFPNLFNYAKTIYDTYILEEAKDETSVAIALGHKTANSGAFLTKLADLRLYGLLDSRGIKATSLAERLTHGSEEERQEATNEAVLNIPLWKELYSKNGVEFQESNFWMVLQKITGVSHLEAQKYADFIRKAYLEDISHIKSDKKPETGTGKKMTDTINTNTSTINIQAGQFSQTIPLTPEGIALAKGFLDLLCSQITMQKKTNTLEEKN